MSNKTETRNVASLPQADQAANPEAAGKVQIVMARASSKRRSTVTVRQLLRDLRRAGFVLVRQTGSHQIFRPPDQERPRVVVPAIDMKERVLFDVLKQCDEAIELFGRPTAGRPRRTRGTG